MSNGMIAFLAISVGFVHGVARIIQKHRKGLDQPKLHSVEDPAPEPEELSPVELKAMGRWFSRFDGD